MNRAHLVLGLVLVLQGHAGAQPLDREPGEPTYLPPSEPPVPPPPPEIPRAITVTVSPFHLPLPLAEVTAELRINDKLSGAVIAGIGRISDVNGVDHGRALELGAQGSYYVFRSFRGLHVGGELLYIHVDEVTTDSSLTGAGLAIAPFVGWKWIHSSGFSFVGQGGLSIAVVEAQNATTSVMERKVFPLLNLNVGWSF